MKVVIFLHEKEIGNEQYDYCHPQKDVMVDWAEYHAKLYDKLHSNIEERNFYMWNLQFVCH